MSVLFTILSSFFQYSVFGSISIFDLSLFVLIGYLAFRIKPSKIDISFISLISFTIFAISTVVFYKEKEYFIFSSFITNSLKLVIYSLGFIYIPKYFSNKSRFYSLIKGLNIVLVIICTIGIFEFLLNQLSFNIDFKFYSSNELYSFSRQIKSVFSEPAHLSIYLGSLYSILLVGEVKGFHSKKFNFTTILVFLTLLLSFSFTGFAFLIIFTLIIIKKYIIEIKMLKQKNIFYFFATALLLGLVYYFISKDELFVNKVTSRFSYVGFMEDGSSTFRILGSFNYTKSVILQSPIIGAGMGQLNSFFVNLNYIPDFYWENQAGGINNIFGSIAIQTGLLGLVLFLIFSYSVFKSKIMLLFVFVLICFSWGYFNTSLFWFYVYLSKVFDYVKA